MDSITYTWSGTISQDQTLSDLKVFMDPEFSRLVNEAADISASGRWAMVNERIEALAATPGAGNAWWVQLIGSLCAQNFSEYHSLKHAFENHQNDDDALLAWRARNLLELLVWSTYCAMNRDNARRGALSLPRPPIGSIPLQMRSEIFLNGHSAWMELIP